MKISSFEGRYSKEVCEQIKYQVNALNCCSLKVNYKAIKGYTDKIITIKINAYSLTDKLNAINILTDYIKALRKKESLAFLA